MMNDILTSFIVSSVKHWPVGLPGLITHNTRTSIFFFLASSIALCTVGPC